MDVKHHVYLLTQQSTPFLVDLLFFLFSRTSWCNNTSYKKSLHRDINNRWQKIDCNPHAFLPWPVCSSTWELLVLYLWRQRHVQWWRENEARGKSAKCCTELMKQVLVTAYQKVTLWNRHKIKGAFNGKIFPADHGLLNCSRNTRTLASEGVEFL